MTFEMWTVTLRSRLGEHLSYPVSAPDSGLAVATARALARGDAPYGLWPWPVVSVHGGWQLHDALDGRR